MKRVIVWQGLTLTTLAGVAKALGKQLRVELVVRVGCDANLRLIERETAPRDSCRLTDDGRRRRWMKGDHIAVVDAVFDVDEVANPFGKRWGQERLTVTREQLAALQSGKLLALDVFQEYVVFLELEKG